MSEIWEMMEALHSSATVTTPPKVECGNRVWAKAWPRTRTDLLHLNSSICFPIRHALHYLRHNLKLCSCCHSKSSSKFSKEGEAGIVGECGALVFLSTKDGKKALVHHAGEQNQVGPHLGRARKPQSRWTEHRYPYLILEKSLFAFFSLISVTLELFPKYIRFVDTLVEN